ncbi:MAG: pyridoxamine 5'-phosphate oxidase family protein [Clostridiales bacterium]|nr:pyridoxamine 5'-phosphate oxidase family protein [Clostridiales bacterium]
MQHRMKEFTMEQNDIDALIARVPAMRISTIDANGYPYTVCVHYIRYDGCFYFHGLPQGEKLDNIARCPKVCLEISELTRIMKEDLPLPCDADAEYESVVVRGDAEVVKDISEKAKVLGLIIDKYVPEMSGFTLPDNMLRGTAVVKVTPVSITGKYHK